MKTLSFAAVAALCLSAGAALADITIEDGYFRSVSPNAKAGAAFMIIRNTGDAEDRLISAQSDWAQVVELHTHVSVDGLMKMTEVEGGIVIPAGESHALKRGGDHVMLMGLTGAVPDDATVTITLNFAKAGEIVLELPVDRSR